MRKHLFFALIIILIACQSSESVELSKGVSIELAKHRKEQLSDITYNLSFDIPADRSTAINGVITISFDLNEVSQDLQIDFKEDRDHLISISANSTDININFTNEHILIKKENLNEGRNEVLINFIAGDQSLNRNEDYLYTLLVPDRARTVFPLFDQPNLKAKYTLALTIPSHWKAQANGPLFSSEKIDLERLRLQFKETAPISSYLFAFTAGAYQEATSEDGNMTMLYRETDEEKTARNIPEIFQLHKASLDWLEDYTEIDYPFQKFDFALIPSFQYGGMEHVGAIFYNERSLMLDKEASINQQLSRGSLIAHETAHMWFGDLVTMDWFDDVWLKEVFANFMAAKIVNPSFPAVDHDLRFLLAHYPRAYAIDRSQGSHPIQQELANLNNAGTLYGAIIYQKAPIIMRNLERLIGAEEFQEGLQEYLNTYSFGNATWDDLIAIMQKRTTSNLQQWNTDWVKSPNMPTIEISKTSEGANTHYNYATLNDSHIWPQQVDLMTTNNGSPQIEQLSLHEKSTSMYQASIIKVNSYNYKGEGYGYFKHPKNELRSLLKSVNEYDHAQERAGAWISAWEEFLNGRVSTKQYLTQLILSIQQEDNPLVINYTLGQLRTMYWHLSSQEEREIVGPAMTSSLWLRLINESNNSIKRVIYQTYVSIASTPNAHKNLIRLWQDKAPEVDLNLSSRDKEQLAYAIAVRDLDGADDIYAQQLQLLTNPDDVKRMQFVKPALSSDKVTRDNFFESLKHAENRSQERWVLTALSYLHHPLRQSSSRAYVLPSLELIEEIQTTGDIFFPKRWLDNTLGAYSDDKTRTIVKEFLNNNPDLSDNLKNKIHQASDILMRSKNIK